MIFNEIGDRKDVEVICHYLGIRNYRIIQHNVYPI
jgi:hypothetical protein